MQSPIYDYGSIIDKMTRRKNFSDFESYFVAIGRIHSQFNSAESTASEYSHNFISTYGFLSISKTASEINLFDLVVIEVKIRHELSPYYIIYTNIYKKLLRGLILVWIALNKFARTIKNLAATLRDNFGVKWRPVRAENNKEVRIHE